MTSFLTQFKPAATTLSSGRLAGKFERGGPVGVRSPAIFQEDARTSVLGFLNLTGSLSRWSFRSLIKPLQKSLSVLRILFRPTPLLAVAALHAVNLAEDQKHEEPKSRES